MGLYSILAPHIDDEVIGCYRILITGQVQTVNYFTEITPERMKEAKACARRFGFRANFFPYISRALLRELTSGTIILAPHIKDHHPHHKMLNRAANALVHAHDGEHPETDLKFYSVDMNVQCDVLDEETRREKQKVLYELFPSQQPLFNQDSKYFLFESLLDTDWTKMRLRGVDVAGEIVLDEKPMWMREDDD